MPKYVVHLHPTADATGKDMPNKFEIEAASFHIENDVAIFKNGAVVAAFPVHTYRAIIKVDNTSSAPLFPEKPDSLSAAAADVRSNLVNAAEA